MARIAHISDLHFGRTNPSLVAALVDDIRAFAPDVLAVSGDLTQRARPRELAEARRFLDALPFARVVVPGNHDIAPLAAPFERALRPWSRFLSIVGETAASIRTADGVAVIGLNTVDPWRFIEGGVARDELARMMIEARRAAHLPLRVLIAHHPIVETHVRPLKLRVRRQRSLLDHLEIANVDMVLTGHLHESFSGPAAARVEVGGERGRALLAVQASTACSTRLRGHLNAWNRIVADAGAARVSIEVRVSSGGAFTRGALSHWQHAHGEWTAHHDADAGAASTITRAAAADR